MNPDVSGRVKALNHVPFGPGNPLRQPIQMRGVNFTAVTSDV